MYSLRGIFKKPETINFLHIGKTGGTAIKHALNNHKESSKFEIILHEHKTTLREIPEGEKLFFAVRDPISRFISGFYSRQRQGKPRYFYPWNKEEKIAFLQFQNPSAIGEALSANDSKAKEIAHIGMNGIGHVKSSYWDWFKNEEYLQSRIGDILFVCRQEQLDFDFQKLKKILKLPNDVSLPTGNVDSHKNPKDLDIGLSDLAEENLMVWYKNDYKFLDIIYEKGLIKTNYSQNFNKT